MTIIFKYLVHKKCVYNFYVLSPLFLETCLSHDINLSFEIKAVFLSQLAERLVEAFLNERRATDPDSFGALVFLESVFNEAVIPSAWILLLLAQSNGQFE